MKNNTLKAFIAVILVQILAFIGMAGYSLKSYDAIMNSMEYKMAIEPKYLYDDRIEFTTTTSRDYENVSAYGMKYVTIDFEENGLAYFSESVDEKPEGNFYIKANKKNSKLFGTYEIEKQNRHLAFDFFDMEYREAYIVFKVNKGNAMIVGMYIDGIPVEEWIKNPPPSPTQENYDNTSLVDEPLL